jgi:hypothetical protein
VFDAQETGASEQQLRDTAAEGLGEMYFRDSGRCAHTLETEFTDVELLEFDLYEKATEGRFLDLRIFPRAA